MTERTAACMDDNRSQPAAVTLDPGSEAGVTRRKPDEHQGDKALARGIGKVTGKGLDYETG